MFLPKPTRRNFLQAAPIAAALFTRPSLTQTTPADVAAVNLRILAAVPTGPAVPADFMGLSYEAMQLEDPTFFSPANVGLVQQFRNLSARGVLRLGGNTSEFGWWKGTPSTPQPVHSRSKWAKEGEPDNTISFAITPEAVRNLDGFLRATGWTCIYGLNLGYGTPELDVAEARFVFATLGSRLQYFQLGNEVDLFKGHLRDPETWNVDTYLAEWLHIARAVQAALPSARFGMPDVASDVTWLTQIADRWPGIADKPNVTTLSHHFYWGGPPTSPDVTVEKLLRPDARVTSKGNTARTAGKQMGLPYRMTEGNTVWQGGKPGLSDSFASALWSADYLLQLMSLGYSGVNLHGGSGHAQAVSVGGILRGESIMKDPAAPHPKPFYTPIANVATLPGAGTDGKLGTEYVLEPTGYGMKFASAFAGATMLNLDFKPGAVNATAYAARRPNGKIIVAILNKDATQNLMLTAPFFDTLQVMRGPALDGNETHLDTVVNETGSRRSAAGQTFILPAHTATLIALR